MTKKRFEPPKDFFAPFKIFPTSKNESTNGENIYSFLPCLSKDQSERLMEKIFPYSILESDLKPTFSRKIDVQKDSKKTVNIPTGPPLIKEAEL